MKYNVMFAVVQGRNPVLREVEGHDAVHAALVAWRAAGMPPVRLISFNSKCSMIINATSVTSWRKE